MGAGFILGTQSRAGVVVTFNLFPGGVMQLYDVLQNGYWHAPF